MEKNCIKIETTGERRTRIAKQILMIIGASVGYVSVGMSQTWPNVFASDVALDNRTIFGAEIVFTDWQMDMIGSIFFLGSLPGFLLAGWLVWAVGRRWSMLAASIPGLSGAFFIALAVNIEMVLVGRFLEGITFGMMGVATRTYIVEIADTDIRGSASVVVNLMMQLGSLSVLSLGIALRWYEVYFISIGLFALYIFLLLTVLPESPTFLVVNKKDDEAEVVLRRLRGQAADIPRAIQSLRKQNEAFGSSPGWRFLLQKDILKRELTLFGLFFITYFTGVQVLKANTVRILESSGLPLDTKLSTLIVIFFLFVGNSLMLLLLDRLGRRRCLLLSFSVLIVAYSILGTYTFLNEDVKPSPQAPMGLEVSLLEESNANVEYLGEEITSELNWNWIPMACLMLAALGQSMGSGPIPWILAPEYFPTSIRSQAVCVCTLVGSIQSFLSLQLFSPMKSLLTDAGLYWGYSATALVGIPYALLFVKETKGLAVG